MDIKQFDKWSIRQDTVIELNKVMIISPMFNFYNYLMSNIKILSYLVKYSNHSCQNKIPY